MFVKIVLFGGRNILVLAVLGTFYGQYQAHGLLCIVSNSEQLITIDLFKWDLVENYHPMNS